MIIDAKLQLCDNESLVQGAAGSYLIGDVLDLGAAGTDYFGNSITESPGEGQQLYMTVTVNTAIAGGDADIVLCTDGSLSGGDLASANEVVRLYFANGTAAGTRKTVTVPSGGVERYLQVQEVASAAITAGAVDVFLSSTPGDSQVGLK